MPNLDDIKKLREETGAGVMDAKKALEDTKGDYKKALEIIKQKGLATAKKKSEREANSGIIEVYSHQGRLGAMLELACETDFVAKNDTFKQLAHEIALQIASMDPKNVDDLMDQPYIKDESKTIKELINENILKIGENIYIKKFNRYELGQ